MRVVETWAALVALLLIAGHPGGVAAQQTADAPSAAQSTAAAPPTREPIFKKGPAQFRSLGGPGPYFPERAERLGISGVVVIQCALAASGALEKCVVFSESPPDQGFGYAALKMATVHWMTAAPDVINGQPVEGEIVRVPVIFHQRGSKFDRGPE